MREAVAAAPAEMRPLMNAILAHWWWEFYQQSAWRFANRSATSEVPGPDIRTWDAPRIFAEIGRPFDAALAAEKELKAVPIGSYGFLLEKGSLPDRYRPTLYDFLAFDALGFYTSADDGVRKDGRDVGPRPCRSRHARGQVTDGEERGACSAVMDPSLRPCDFPARPESIRSLADLREAVELMRREWAEFGRTAASGLPAPVETVYEAGPHVPRASWGRPRDVARRGVAAVAPPVEGGPRERSDRNSVRVVLF